MPRPSGMCEEQPCYTPEDEAEIQAELAIAEAQVLIHQDHLDSANAAVVTLSDELETCQNNRCPGGGD